MAVEERHQAIHGILGQRVLHLASLAVRALEIDAELKHEEVAQRRMPCPPLDRFRDRGRSA